MFSLCFTCRDSSMSTFCKTYKTFPSRNVTPLIKTLHLLPAVPVLSAGNQNYTRLTGKLFWRLCSWVKGLYPTALFGLNSSQQLTQTILEEQPHLSPASFTRDYPSQGANSFIFLTMLVEQDTIPAHSWNNLILAAFLKLSRVKQKRVGHVGEHRGALPGREGTQNTSHCIESPQKHVLLLLSTAICMRLGRGGGQIERSLSGLWLCQSQPD